MGHEEHQHEEHEHPDPPAGHPPEGGGHGGHHENALGRPVGITMAILGVLLALCSALVGGARAELIAAKVEQTAAIVKAESASTKYRMLMAELQQLHALTPEPVSYQQGQQQIARLHGHIKQSEPRHLADMLGLQSSLVLNTVTPTSASLSKFAAIIHKLDGVREKADAWQESYEDEIQSREAATERYEWAQLASEIGIVVCAVAMLLELKPAWYVAVALLVVCVVLASGTMVTAHGRGAEAEGRIVAAHQAYTDSKGPSDKNENEELLKSIDEIPQLH